MRPEMIKRGRLPALSTRPSETERERRVIRKVEGPGLTASGGQLDNSDNEGGGVRVHTALHSLEHIHGLAAREGGRFKSMSSLVKC